MIEDPERGAGPPGWVSIRLPVREPFHAASLFAFLTRRAIPGIEHGDRTTYSRVLDLPRGPGIVELGPEPPGAIRARLRLEDWRDLAPAVQCCRRLLDLDADPVAIDGALGADPLLAALVAAAPGRRAAGSVNGSEVAVRAVVGQQISVSGARTVTGRLVAALGAPLAVPHGSLTHAFPTAESLAAVDPSLLPMPKSRQRTLISLCRAIADGRITIDPGADRDELSAGLLALPGIGPWTAGYLVMRGLGDPDVFLPTDLGVRRALARLGADVEQAEAWRPWRSYAVHHLWDSL